MYMASGMEGEKRLSFGHLELETLAVEGPSAETQPTICWPGAAEKKNGLIIQNISKNECILTYKKCVEHTYKKNVGKRQACDKNQQEQQER